MARIYRTDGTVERDVVPAVGKAFTLAELQKVVGGYIQAVHLPGRRSWLIVNEEGALMDLPPNDFATTLCQEQTYSGNLIVGDAIECDYVEFI